MLQDKKNGYFTANEIAEALEESTPVTVDNDPLLLEYHEEKSKNKPTPPKEVVKNDKGKILTTVPANTEFYLYKAGITVRYNSLAKNIEFTGCIDDMDLSKLTLTEIIPLTRGLLSRNGFNISSDTLMGNVCVIAKKYSYNPICDYMDQCYVKHGNATGRIDKLFDVFEIQSDALIYKDMYRTLFKKWLVNVATLAFNDGTKGANGVLVIKGSQGIGKTRFLFFLLPKHLSQYLKDGVILKPSNKDHIINLHQYLIVELGELPGTLTDSNVNELKNFITSKSDSVRPPYGRVTEKFIRCCSFYATVNDSHFLKDDTGERRWWVIPVQAIKEDVRLNIDQVWGEVMHLMKNGYPCYLTNEEKAILEQSNRQHKQISNEEQILYDLLDWESPFDTWTYQTMSDLSKIINGIRGYNVTPTKLGRAVNRIKDTGVKPYCLLERPKNNMNGRKYKLPHFKSNFTNW